MTNWDEIWEEFMLMTFSEYIRLTGRDILAMIIGFGICLIIWALSETIRKEKK